MRRFFISQEQSERAKDGSVILTGTDVNHIVHVLRMGQGDKLLLSATNGQEFHCVIDRIEHDKVVCSVCSASNNHTEPAVSVTLIQGVPKGEKMEFIIQKTVELGVCEIVPAMMERTVVRFHTPQDGFKKQTRWQKIAEEASKQCGRGCIPSVAEPQMFKQALSQISPDALKLIAYENEAEYSLKNRIEKAMEAGSVTQIAVLIGPEGGISPNEFSLAIESGFQSVSLGRRILRTETAGIAVLSAIRYVFED